MDNISRDILQKTMRFLTLKGYKVLSEFALPNKKRVDIIALSEKKKIIIVEVKSNKKDIKTDKKWKNYLKYCNYFYFSCNDNLKDLNFSENVGIIKNNSKGTKIVKSPKYKKLSKNTKDLLIFKIALSASSKFHRLVDPEFKKQKNNSIYIYKKINSKN
ncbi:MAG: hypothetical protein CFH26_00446 [Alphaproteobacteria bacterium MarineAlpha6_Bin4]|nr:MAG: hypothetical protein CFH25_00766 [Alphaproteobacteria bacterium MarineAlpha6_Bin3]PPR37983.1 MAG: hypothetical protein CFH26_00446 [Alphaproteobacteria bacterium MarineAlpha6_Bin4]|tara:strand:+ start:6527 stop:7003 length:477 start_codon:yes stop_codon:yes gene_type:complete